MGSFFLVQRVAVFDKIKFAMHILVSDGNSLNLDFCWRKTRSFSVQAVDLWNSSAGEFFVSHSSDFVLTNVLDVSPRSSHRLKTYRKLNLWLRSWLHSNSDLPKLPSTDLNFQKEMYIEINDSPACCATLHLHACPLSLFAYLLFDTVRTCREPRTEPRRTERTGTNRQTKKRGREERWRPSLRVFTSSLPFPSLHEK